MKEEIIRIETIETGFFKLDGGAMFGIIPKSMWQKLNPPDENNLCTWALRCLFVETNVRKILIDTGIGNKQDAKFRSHFNPFGDFYISDALHKKGIDVQDITDVFLTHLHFDHVGGAVSRNENGDLVPTFPNATYWTNEKHWKTAWQPNAREAASFLKENILPLQAAGVLKMIPLRQNSRFLNLFRIQFTDGHTDALMMIRFEFKGKTIVFCADTLPTSLHIGLPYVMAYDIRPLVSLREKTALLEKAVENKYILFFEHDPKFECGTVTKNENGRILLEKAGRLADFLN